MRFSVLGKLEVSVNGEPLSLGGPKQRTLLATLLLARNSVVSRDLLIDALWGPRLPPSAADSLDTYLYRLRKLLGPDRLVRDAGGYRLRIEPGELDADEFERLVTSAASAVADDPARAAGHFAAALELWRGPLCAEVLDGADVGAQAQRLEELRLGALESRIEAQLALGAGTELVAELEQLVSEHPLRERVIASLMLALYRAGRQTAALDAFQATRRCLVDELGLEPGPELHDLQRRILEHDPSLGAPRRLVPLSGPRGARSLVLAALGVLAALVVGVLALTAGATSRPPSLARGVSGILGVDSASDRLVAATALVGLPAAVTAAGGSLWVADPVADRVYQVDPNSGSVLNKIPVGAEPGSIVSGDNAVWTASTIGSTVTRIDPSPSTDTAVATIHLPGANPDAIAYGAGGLWVADSADRELFEIDPATDGLERTWQLDLQPSAIATGDGAVWVAGYDDGTVEKLDPATAKVTGRVHVGDGPVALAFASGSLWVANSLDSTVSRVNPSTVAVRAVIAVGSGPAAVAAGPGAVWVANQYSGTVSRIDPRRDKIVSSAAVGGAPTSLTVNGGRLWVGVPAVSGSHRGGTLVIATTATNLPTSNIDAVDPAIYDIAFNPQFTGLAYDALVNFQQSPGAAGLRLVPDLAVSIPPPTDGGRTYAFRIRPGIRYSDGQPLRAGDFRRGIERLFRLGSIGIPTYGDLVGARECERDPRTCNLANGIVTNNVVGTVTFHFTAPDPEFLFQLTEEGFSAPIPPGTPDHETGQRAVPGTGPYQIVTVTPTEIRFVRNPYFREWSHAAQPAGNPNAIVWRTMPSTQAGVSAIDQGRADWLSGQVPLAQYHRLEFQNPAELHSNPVFSVEFLPLNTHLPPFNNLLARQALNYAINRATIAELYGGPSFATPTCQPIAPGLPGYRPYCPYTLHPHADGAWSAPNMARARQLVAESGTTGDRVQVVGSPDEGFIPPTTPAYVAGVLRALGYRVRLRLLPLASITQRMWNSFQISVDGDWTANWPDPSAYIPAFFSCDGANSNGYYCDPALDREMRHAELLEPTDPPESRALWETIDRQLTDNALWVPTVTFRDIEITSSRLHNYEYNPVWGFLADQAWLQ
jgi:ABC-type transport system substrate-binding protein/DNA-binding SARP family transcriptional activator